MADELGPFGWDDVGKVVRLEVIDGGEEGGDALLRLQRPERYCRHRHSTLNSTSRRVFCADCELELDPFDVLARFAADYDRHKTSIERIRAEEARRAKELENVERELRNAKGRLRTANRALERADV